MNHQDWARRRRRQLCGESHVVEGLNLDKDELAIIFKLTLERLPVTPQAILTRRMEISLQQMSNSPITPFLLAIKDLYERMAVSGSV